MSNNLSFIETLARDYWDIYGTRVVLNGKWPRGGANGNPPDWLTPVVSELLSNTGPAREVFDTYFYEDGLTMKKLRVIGSERQKSPHRITITSNDRQLTIEDYYDLPDPQLAIANIQQALGSDKAGKTTKRSVGGVGIFEIKKALDQHGGKLEYRIRGQRIVATVIWQK